MYSVGYFILALIFMLFINHGIKKIPVSLGNEEFHHVTISQPETGTFVELPTGRTRYTLLNPVLTDSKKSPHLIVFIHGFIEYSNAQWDYYGKRLVENGYRVLYYDLYGHGYSSNPTSIPHDEKLYVSQLALLLHKLKLDDEPLTLVGMSLGGAIAGVYTSMFPENVKNLILLAPAGYPVNEPLTAKVGKLPLIGEILNNLVTGMILHDRIPDAYPDSEKYKKEIETTRAAIKFQLDNNPGYLPGILSTLREFPFGELGEYFEKVGKLKHLKTLLIWGDQDLTISYSNSELFLQAIPSAKLITLPKTGHCLERQEAPVILDSILKFLS